MSDTIRAYLAEVGDTYIASPDYDRRRLALGEKMAGGPVSLQEMADTLGLPVPVVADLWMAWKAETEAKRETRH